MGMPQGHGIVDRCMDGIEWVFLYMERKGGEGEGGDFFSSRVHLHVPSPPFPLH